MVGAQTMKNIPTGNEQLVMIVDDEPDMLNMLKLVVQRKCGCEVELADSGKTALDKLKTCRPDVIVTDIKMPDLDGLTLMQKVREIDETISVIIMTGFGTIEMAVQALKNGAYDFLQKPFDKEHIVRVILRCLERTRLLRENLQLQEKLNTVSPPSPEGFIGQAPALRQALDLIAKVADKDVTVLIRGESGTGKEGAARALHTLSNRRNRRMITVNCPALPEHILESELFGYSKGAFTGANKDKKGLFLEADHSTILLDEIADIPVGIQTKLLRVLQEKEIQPLGQNTSIKIDVRVVASTNQNLEAKMKAGEFREDLFYRLNVVTISMPGLTELKEDIPLLVHHFLQRYKKEFEHPQLRFSPESFNYLQQKKWRGNVRELQNTVKRAVLLAPSDIIEPRDLCDHEGEDCSQIQCPEHPAKSGGIETQMPYKKAKEEIIRRFSTSYLTELLIRCHGNVTAAAKKSGLERQALQRIMRRYDIRSKDFKSDPA